MGWDEYQLINVQLNTAFELLHIKPFASDKVIYASQ